MKVTKQNRTKEVDIKMRKKVKQSNGALKYEETKASKHNTALLTLCRHNNIP